MINHFAHLQTIESDDDLSRLPKTVQAAIKKWCEDKSKELLAVNEVTFERRDSK